MSPGLRNAAIGVVVMLVAYPLVGVAQAPQIALGTWKMNVAKSRGSLGQPLPKSQTTHDEAVPGGGKKTTQDTVDATGKSSHTEIVSMFDGKEAELKGAPQPTTRLYSKTDDRSYQYVTRVNGKVTTTTRVVFSADGKTRTITTTGMSADGKPVDNISVWDRQ